MEAGLGETKESREYKVETENDTVIPAKASNWKTNHNEASPGLVCPRNRRLGRANMGNDQGSSGCPNLGSGLVKSMAHGGGRNVLSETLGLRVSSLAFILPLGLHLLESWRA